MKATWYIAHQTEGRTRLRSCVPLENGEELIDLTDAFIRLDGVEEVIPRASTGSLIIQHPMQSWQSLLPQLKALGLRIGEAPEQARVNALPQMVQLFSQLDKSISDFSGGKADTRTLLFFTYLVLGITQLYRGQVLGPAAGLFWYAFETLRDMDRERSDQDN
ncbi:MAG: hypothetical protein PVI97_05670 [Candidatus Thiodiazotropha sp.]|jgi:hypothetical protein